MQVKTTWLLPIWTVVWKVSLFFLLWAILLAPLLVPFSAKLSEAQQSSPLQTRLYLDVAGALTIVAAAWIMARFADRRPFVTLGFAPASLARDLLLGLGIGAGWLLLSLAILWAGDWITPLPPAKISWSALGLSGVALLFNTLAQEVLSRSYIFQTLESQTGPRWAIFLSSVLFMAYHAGAFKGTWLPALNVFAAGILFGLAYSLTGNLWLPIGIHFIWNFLLGPVFGLTVSGQNQLSSGWQVFSLQGPELLTGGSFGLEGGAVVTLTTIIGIVALWLLFRRPRKVI